MPMTRQNPFELHENDLSIVDLHSDEAVPASLTDEDLTKVRGAGFAFAPFLDPYSGKVSAAAREGKKERED